MASNLQLLDYTFMFDPEQTYQHLFQFEQDLQKFFRDKQMDMQIVKTMEGGQGRRILIITKKDLETHINTPKNPVGRPQSSGSRLKELAHRELRAPAKAFINKGK
jgi:hypothetical protein